MQFTYCWNILINIWITCQPSYCLLFHVIYFKDCCVRLQSSFVVQSIVFGCRHILSPVRIQFVARWSRFVSDLKVILGHSTILSFPWSKLCYFLATSTWVYDSRNKFWPNDRKKKKKKRKSENKSKVMQQFFVVDRIRFFFCHVLNTRRRISCCQFNCTPFHVWLPDFIVASFVLLALLLLFLLFFWSVLTPSFFSLFAFVS